MRASPLRSGVTLAWDAHLHLPRSTTNHRQMSHTTDQARIQAHRILYGLLRHGIRPAVTPRLIPVMSWRPFVKGGGLRTPYVICVRGLSGKERFAKRNKSAGPRHRLQINRPRRISLALNRPSRREPFPLWKIQRLSTMSAKSASIATRRLNERCHSGYAKCIFVQQQQQRYIQRKAVVPK